MRKIFNLIVWISSLSILLLSCSKDETENNKEPNDDNNMVTVSLGLTGDILEVEETPLSRTTERADIYGVQIYSSPKDEDNYEPYGSGIFLDKSKMQVKLFKDRKYKFEMTVFPNGMIINGTTTLTGYKSVFMGHEEITDSIKYKEDDWLEYLDASFVSDYGANYLERLNTDRYYGKLIGYIPLENGSANIEMKRVVAGLTFRVVNLLENYSLKIETEYANPIELEGTTNNLSNAAEYQYLIGLTGEDGRYTDKWFENPIDEVPFKFTWTNGERTESFTQTVTLKRKMNYTFQITIPETFLVSNGINVTEEDKTWDDDVTVDNIYFGDLTIENEEDLETYRDTRYTKVTGNLTISNLTIKHFNDAFYYLQSVGGNLVVRDVNSYLEHEFANLKYVGGDLKFIATQNNTMNDVYNFKYLGNISEIGGNFEISSIAQNSFVNLEFINTSSLIKVGGDIILKNLPALKDYCSLKTVLQNHTGQFIVSGNAYNPTKEQILAGECSIQ